MSWSQVPIKRPWLRVIQTYKRAHLPWVGIVPDFCNHLWGCGVPEIEPLDKGENVWGVRRSPCVLVAPFGGVAKEGGIS